MEEINPPWEKPRVFFPSKDQKSENEFLSSISIGRVFRGQKTSLHPPAVWPDISSSHGIIWPLWVCFLLMMVGLHVIVVVNRHIAIIACSCVVPTPEGGQIFFAFLVNLATVDPSLSKPKRGAEKWRKHTQNDTVKNCGSLKNIWSFFISFLWIQFKRGWNHCFCIFAVSSLEYKCSSCSKFQHPSIIDETQKDL